MKTTKIILFTLAFEAIFAFGCKRKDQVKLQTDLNPAIVNISAAQRRNIKLDTVKMVSDESELSLTGKVSFNEDRVGKVYPLVGGNVEKVNVSLGDAVRKGQVLAILRSGDINDIQNQYKVAVASMQIAKRNLDIADELYKTNVNSEKDLIGAKNDYHRAETEVNRIRKQLSIFGANASNDAEYKVLAPRDGFIVEKNISENMEVRSDNNQSLFTVSFLQNVWILADVYESDLSKIHLGDSVEVTTVAYPDKIFHGKIEQVGNVLDPDSKTLKVRITLDNKEGLLKPEMFAVVKVRNAEKRKVLAIPSQSLVFENSRYYVMKYRNDTTYKKIPVEIVRTIDGHTVVNGDIKSGDILVTEGSLLVSSNNK